MNSLKVFGLFLLMASPVMAEKTNCKISSTVFTDAQGCASFTTRVWMMSEEECKDYAAASKVTRFFGVLKTNERVIETTYTFKTKLRMVRERMIFESSESVCR